MGEHSYRLYAENNKPHLHPVDELSEDEEKNKL